VYYTFHAPLTGIKGDLSSAANTVVLRQNYPNPFNGTTQLRFSTATRNWVTLKVFDILGREVNMLTEGELAPADYSIEFDGSGLSSGVYIVQLRSGHQTVIRRMVLLR
jgi:hypothetical protein